MAKPSKIQPLGSHAKWLRMFVIAEQGWGKTVLCGTAPRALYLTTDPEGTVSAKARGSLAEEWKVESWDDLDEAHVWLRDEGHKLFDFLIVDNITEAQRFAAVRSMEISKKMSNAPTKLDPYVLQQMDYQRSQNMLLQFVVKTCDLPMHVIFTSHLKGTEDSEGELMYSAAIHGQKGQLCNQIVGYANVVGMGQSILDANSKLVRRLWFSHHGPYRGKDRFIALGEFMDNPTMPKILGLIDAAKTANAGKPAGAATARKTAARPVRKTSKTSTTANTTKAPARRTAAVGK